VYCGDLYAALPAGLRGRVDVLVCNAPYVPTDAIALMPPEAREHELRAALDGGADGVEVQRRVAAGAPEWLAPGGWLLVETSGRQTPQTVAAFVAAGLDAAVVTDEDLAATVVVGARR
jgi:release factor glutamine methyltransferase